MSDVIRESCLTSLFAAGVDRSKRRARAKEFTDMQYMTISKHMNLY